MVGPNPLNDTFACEAIIEVVIKITLGSLLIDALNDIAGGIIGVTLGSPLGIDNFNNSVQAVVTVVRTLLTFLGLALLVGTNHPYEVSNSVVF